MSQSATGSILCLNGTKFAALFSISGGGEAGEQTYRFTGNVDSDSDGTPTPFDVPEATLSFDNIAQLSGERRFTGNLGGEGATVTIEIENGVVASGSFNKEVGKASVEPARRVSGTGNWTASSS
ncbi:hypothetical protein R3P38DRAFT_2865985 [Favolaschia claudopus]|uniref:Uncharacterized protein n=1 Tax=Favolaschia claudopus TaxID=2862362 RepID=A0AAW0DIL1_9AGAR